MTRRVLSITLLLGVAALVAACGGGGGDDQRADPFEDLEQPGTTASPSTAPCVPGTALVVFVNPAVASDRIPEIQAALAAVPGVVDITYVDQQQAYEEFARLFADDPDLVATVDPANLPASFRVVVDDPSSVDAVRAAAAALDGVGSVDEEPSTPAATAPSNC